MACVKSVGPKMKKPDWYKELPAHVKAEMLAATFHLLSDHMPEIFNKVPKWLQQQIRQAMMDCSIDHKDFSKQDLKLCIEYGQWLDKKYPQPEYVQPITHNSLKVSG